jgi:hypothetical protein
LPVGDTPDVIDQIPGAYQAPGSPYHHSDLKLSRVLAAVPSGSRRFRDQLEALECALSEPDLAGVRGDFAGHLTAVYRVLVLHASWGGQDGRGQARAPRGVTSPTRARICALVGGRDGKPLSVSTYKRCIKWWKQRGYLAVAREGWAPMLRTGSLLDPRTDRPTSQAFVICGPRRRLRPAQPTVGDLLAGGDPLYPELARTAAACGKPARKPGAAGPSDLNGPLTGFRRNPVKEPPSRGRASQDQNRAPKKDPVKRAKTGAPRPPVLQRGLFGGVTDSWWIHITHAFAAAGWNAADLVHAVDHLPDGTQHPYTDAVTTPGHRGGAARLLTWRLRQWLTPDGSPAPSPARQRAERARTAKAARERQDAELGLSARAARIRAAAPRGYDHADARPQDPRSGPQRPPERLVGWAVPKYGPEARAAAPAADRPATRPYNADPRWHAALAAAAAAATAMDTGDAAAAAAHQAEAERLLAEMDQA